MNWDSPITSIKGVGTSVATHLEAWGIHTVGDLLENYPRRYEDYSTVLKIRSIKPGPTTIEAVIKQAKGRYVARGMHITEAIASDETGSVRLVWFNQPYRETSLKAGKSYYISGQYELSRSRFAIMNPSIELVGDFPVNTARIVPVYRQSKSLTSNQIRKYVREAVPVMRSSPETLPAWLLEEQRLMARAPAIEAMHFPDDGQQLEAARKRLGFEEVFELSLASLLNKYELLRDASLAIPFKLELAKKFVAGLPFDLTDAQRKVIWRIYQDMEKTQPMNRLVEGDVGSGKTVVATMASLMAIAGGYQAVLMAPTELLARQHAETVHTLLRPLGMEDTVALLIGGMSSTQKATIMEQISKGQAKFIIGTHALIQEGVDMHKLGLVVIDEQHRFGVEQRKKLMAKAGHMPHLLSLTATPIPRSLALTLYGELDISILGDKPPGRKPVITEICSPHSREQLYTRIDEELAAGRQMFVVCPLITDSPLLAASSVEHVYEQLSKHAFKHRRVAMLHGKMKPAQKQAVMQDFSDHNIDILVSTTVIEVGVDVPNASIMLIEAADRFGLAQIHQLRGRVGRGGYDGYCYLMMSDASAPPKRLEALERSNDGFKLAELDLEIRGPGAIYGTLQHGQLDLRIAKLTDTKLIAAARNAAQSYIERGENLLQYPVTYQHVNRVRAVTNLN